MVTTEDIAKICNATNRAIDAVKGNPIPELWSDMEAEDRATLLNFVSWAKDCPDIHPSVYQDKWIALQSMQGHDTLDMIPWNQTSPSHKAKIKIFREICRSCHGT